MLLLCQFGTPLTLDTSLHSCLTISEILVLSLPLCFQLWWCCGDFTFLSRTSFNHKLTTACSCSCSVVQNNKSNCWVDIGEEKPMLGNDKYSSWYYIKRQFGMAGKKFCVVMDWYMRLVTPAPLQSARWFIILLSWWYLSLGQVDSDKLSLTR